ncbi:hypothetical protein RB620_04850 [Paenibacillus sp. LHD-117]|uniref:hypothetical protein n=1 Tax=Paenibacillus sp. LHD-117 TaxID=3071412 RepID=UPI0027DFAA00|nr:hypothetical protein [Paenibacillus sp. LHD-117]MDQ6418763.1 hypothetical protein [Paenibacillus sp. LHD-117]
MDMLIRKAISTFVAAGANAIFFALAMYEGLSGQFLSTLGVVSFVAFPVVLIYGSLVSLVLEFATVRWVPNRVAGSILSGLGHAGFGALFGWMLDLDPFGSRFIKNTENTPASKPPCSRSESVGRG